MHTVLAILGMAMLLLVCLIGMAALVFGLPGTLIILAAAAVYAWSTGFATVHWGTLGWLAFLSLVAEGLEFAAAGLGAAGRRPSRRVTIGALAGGFAGGIIGTPFLFGIGALIGALLGAFTGAAVAVASEGGDMRTVLGAGLAALRGRLLGFIAKAAIAAFMVIFLFAAVLF